MKQYKKGIYASDIHYPEQDNSSVSIVFQFTKDFDPDYFILGGDQLHLDTISFYNRGKPKLVEGKRLKAEYEGFQKDILNPLNKILPRSCKKYFFIGNHENRAERYTESDSQLEGIIEPENYLNLKGWSIIPFNAVLTLGHMNFIHGVYYNKYFAAKTVDAYDENIFFGHVHTNQIFTKHTQVRNNPKQGVGIGCLCNINPHYNRSKPNHWLHQFMYFYLMKDGTFHYYLPIIIEGHCVINNKLYRG